MLKDKFNRLINYLRISVTDRCNLRCKYCMPANGIQNYDNNELLTYEEIYRIVNNASKIGINRVRITGGEPLVRKDIDKLVSMISGIKEIDDIAMTTNGILLENYAEKLKKAGLKRLNISLDTFDKEKFKDLTRGGDINLVFEGIKTAIEYDFQLVKINVLIYDNLLESDILKFLELSSYNKIHIRFLEYMPVFNQNFTLKMNNINIKNKILEIANTIGNFDKKYVYGNETSEDYQFTGGKGTFGFILPITNKFCYKCNRLRITSNGFVKLCLHSNKKFNIKELLRKNCSDIELQGFFKKIILEKPESHNLDKIPLINDYFMCQIGG
jgi:cyclic pyranopterin phosphate synthase